MRVIACLKNREWESCRGLYAEEVRGLSSPNSTLDLYISQITVVSRSWRNLVILPTSASGEPFVKRGFLFNSSALTGELLSKCWYQTETATLQDYILEFEPSQAFLESFNTKTLVGLFEHLLWEMKKILCIWISRSRLSRQNWCCCLLASVSPPIERQNLTMRMNMCRFNRLRNSFSKKLENLRVAVALHFFQYNFMHIHQSLMVSPAMKARISDRICAWNELLASQRSYQLS